MYEKTYKEMDEQLERDLKEYNKSRFKKFVIIPLSVIFCLFILAYIFRNPYTMSYDKALKENKPIVILFRSRTCLACINFAPLFKIISKKYSYKFNFVEEYIGFSIPIEKAKKFNIQWVPTLDIIDPIKKKSYTVEMECLFDQKCLEKTLEDY